jgi:hypothetical protein
MSKLYPLLLGCALAANLSTASARPHEEIGPWSMTMSEVKDVCGNTLGCAWCDKKTLDCTALGCDQKTKECWGIQFRHASGRRLAGFTGPSHGVMTRPTR